MPVQLSGSITGYRTSELPPLSTVAAGDLLWISQLQPDGSYASHSISFAMFQALSRIQLVYVAASRAAQPGEMGFALNGSASSLVLTLPDLASWAGYEMQVINCGPSGTPTIQCSGSDIIVSPTGGANSATMSVGGPGSSFGLRKCTYGVPGWYITRA